MSHHPTDTAVDFFIKRKRVPMACLRCRKRKIKCITSEESSGRPCERCTRRGFLCEYISVGDQRAQSTFESSPPGRPATISPSPSPPSPYTELPWDHSDQASYLPSDKPRLNGFNLLPGDFQSFAASDYTPNQSSPSQFHTSYSYNSQPSYTQAAPPYPMPGSSAQSPPNPGHSFSNAKFQPPLYAAHIYHGLWSFPPDPRRHSTAHESG
ncbi:hypothetical protein DFH09DRAFT_1164177, partial [Mycena vulgaris]